MMKFHCLNRLSVTVMQMKMESFILRQSKENQSSGQTEQKEMYVSPSKQDTFGQLSIRLELWDHLERKVQKFRLRIRGENLSILDFLSSRTQQRLDQMDR